MSEGSRGSEESGKGQLITGGKFVRRIVSGLAREAEREELRRIQPRRAYNYAERMRERLPGRLGSLMKAAGVTWYGLEQRCGISREMIGKIVRGETKKPSLPLVAQLCYGLGISLLELVALLEEWHPARFGPH